MKVILTGVLIVFLLAMVVSIGFWGVVGAFVVGFAGLSLVGKS